MIHYGGELYFLLTCPRALLKLIIAHRKPFVHATLPCSEWDYRRNRRPIIFGKLNWMDELPVIEPVDHPQQYYDVLLTPTAFNLGVSISNLVPAGDAIVEKNELFPARQP